MHQRVMRALHGELVRRADERQPGEPGDLGRRCLGEAGRGVDPGADRRAAERQPIDALQRIVDPLQIVVEHAGIARPFLPERDRRRILHVGAADLDDVLPFLRLRRDRVVQCAHRRDQPLRHAERRRDVHRGGKRVVGRLRHVDVIVGMHRRLAAERRAGELAGAVRDDLVDVHVELRAAAGHPDMQRKHVVMLPGQDLVGDLDDQRVGLVASRLPAWLALAAAFFRMA